MKTDDYLIEDILWKGTLNLIGGPSGVGKTTWLLPLLKDWSEGLPVLNGKASKPCPWVYVSSDRGLRETNRTLARLGLSDWDIPCWVVEEIMPVDSIDMLHVFERFPKVGLYVIEGLQSFIPEGRNQNKTEMNWIVALRKYAMRAGEDKTILAITHTPKERPGENYQDARSSFLGSVSLGACCSTMILFERAKSGAKGGKNGAAPQDSREVTIMPTNAPHMHLSYDRDSQGRYVLMNDPEWQNSLTIECLFSDWPEDKPVTSQQLNDWAAKSQISMATLHRWVNEQMTLGRLEKVQRGVYKKLPLIQPIQPV